MKKLVVAVIFLGVVVSSAACDVRLTARRATVRLIENKLVLVLPTNGTIHGGEVVIALENYSPTKAQFVLVRTPLLLAALPEAIATAKSANDNKAVLSVGAPMRGAKQSLLGIVPVTVPSKQTLHIYLKPGETYLLFNRLASRAHAPELQLSPVAG